MCSPIALDGISERMPTYSVYSTDDAGNRAIVISIDASYTTAADDNDSLLEMKNVVYDNVTTFWMGGRRPLDRPVCGFTGADCDYTVYYCSAAAVVALVLMVVAGLIYRFHRFAIHF